MSGGSKFDGSADGDGVEEGNRSREEACGIDTRECIYCMERLCKAESCDVDLVWTKD